MVNKQATPAPAEPRVSDDDWRMLADGTKRALFDKMLAGEAAHIRQAMENGAKANRERERADKAEATIASQAAEMAEAREILAGTDAGSLPNDMPLARIAEIRMDERHKYLWQVRDTCTRAEAAEAALKAAREAQAHFKGCTVVLYEHGGARVYLEDGGGARDLIMDLYEPAERRDAILAALSPPTKEF